MIAKAIRSATAAAAAYLFAHIILVHGCVEEILTDLGSHFKGSVLQQVLKLLDVKHLRTTAYHAQADGQAERCFRTLINIMSNFNNQKDWDQILLCAVLVMNTMSHETTGFSPF